MRFALSLGCFCFIAALAVAQEVDPKANDPILKELAKAYKDERSVEQIKQDNALIEAASKGDLDAIRKALKDGARINAPYLDPEAFLDPGDSGYTAVMAAVNKQQNEALKLLLEHKPDLEVKHPRGYTALHLAVLSDRNVAVDLLVKAGAKQDPQKLRFARNVIDAACQGFQSQPHEPFPPYPGAPRDPTKVPDLLTLLKQGADANSTNSKGYTALMYAANLGLVDNVNTLLAHGADATLKSEGGQTALSLAEREDPKFRLEERRAVVKVLQEHLAKQK